MAAHFFILRFGHIIVWNLFEITSPGYATEPTSYRVAHIMVIDKKDININSNSNINNMNLESAHVPRPA